MRADLHIHSTVSDGSDTINELIDKAKKKRLDAIAITDHDTVAHFLRIPDHCGIQVTGGVELSAVHYKTNIRAHILGYNITRPELITPLTQPLLGARNRSSEKQADILIRSGFKIDMDKISRADGKCLYKQHIMDWLVTTKQVNEMFGVFYQKTFKNGGICAFDIEYIDVFDAVKTVKAAGGLAVLAHPGQQQNCQLIPELVDYGLDGLEFNHYANNEEDKKLLQYYADRYDLFLTGGSDYHGKYESTSCDIGDFLSEEGGIKAICLKQY